MRPGGNGSRVRLALGAVFAIPFLYSAQGALRGSLFAGRFEYFGDNTSISGFVAWAVTAGLAALWLGLGLRLGLARRLPDRIRDALGAVLTLAGAAVLLFSARLLSLH
jgi:hypothetical protein